MSTYSFMCKYYKVLDDYKKGELLLPKHKLFEYVAAIKLNMIMWEDILNIPEARLNTQYTVDDSGIDIISYNLTVAGQVKYVNKLTWSKLNTFEGFSNHLEQVSKRIVIVRHDTELSSRVKMICKIIRIDMVEELKSTPIMTINKYLNYSKLSIDGKIRELIEFGRKPKTNTKFSDGQNMYSFWYPIVRYRKLNLATYTKLREASFMMITETEDDFQVQINSLLKYIDDYVNITGFDYESYDDFIIWRECKTYRKCEHEPWIQLLDCEILKRDYYKHLKVVDPDIYYIAKRVDELVELIEEGISIFDDDIWLRCLNDYKLCDVWPYNNLFKNENMCVAYFSMTVNFPSSDYDSIYTDLKIDEEMNAMFDFSDTSRFELFE